MTLTLALSSVSQEPLALSASELQELANLVLCHEGVKRPVELSVVVASEQKMTELNEEFRGVNAPTDVLAIELERPNDPSLLPGELCCLGDIVLCPSYIAAQARGFGVSPKDETRLLTIHGLLHLLGYEHEDDSEAKAMEQVQNRLVVKATEGRLLGVSLGPHEKDAL